MKWGDRGTSCTSWFALKRDIEIAAYDMGNPIISNGSTLSGKSNDGSRSRNNRRFICGTLGKTFKKSVAMPITKSMQYRETSIIKNRKNNRPDGQTGPKRRKVVGSTAKCPFSFTVKWDHRGFYVELKQNAGDPYHKFHPQILKPTSMSFPTRLLTEEQLDDTKEVVSATCNKGVGRNFIRRKFGRFINSIKIAYLSSKSDNSKSNATKGDIVRMLDDFEHSDEISFTTLSDVPIDQLTDKLNDERCLSTQETLTIASTKHAKKTVVNTDIATLQYGEQIEAAAKQERIERKLKSTDILFVAIAWLVTPAFRFFKLAPEVI